MYFLEQSFNYTTGIDGYDYDDVYYDDNDNNTGAGNSYSSSSSSEEDYSFCNTNVIIGIHGNKVQIDKNNNVVSV